MKEELANMKLLFLLISAVLLSGCSNYSKWESCNPVQLSEKEVLMPRFEGHCSLSVNHGEPSFFFFVNQKKYYKVAYRHKKIRTYYEWQFSPFGVDISSKTNLFFSQNNTPLHYLLLPVFWIIQPDAFIHLDKKIEIKLSKTYFEKEFFWDRARGEDFIGSVDKSNHFSFKTNSHGNAMVSIPWSLSTPNKKYNENSFEILVHPHSSKKIFIKENISLSGKAIA